jgi:hypothetical protein
VESIPYKVISLEALAKIYGSSTKRMREAIHNGHIGGVYSDKNYISRRVVIRIDGNYSKPVVVVHHSIPSAGSPLVECIRIQTLLSAKPRELYLPKPKGKTLIGVSLQPRPGSPVRGDAILTKFEVRKKPQFSRITAWATTSGVECNIDCYYVSEP